MLHAGADLLVSLHPPVQLLTLLAGDLRLVGKQVCAGLHEFFIALTAYADARHLPPAQPLDEHHARGRLLEQRLIVGDEQHRQTAGAQEVREPAHGLAVQVVARLVQQQQLRLVHEQIRQLELDALAAGEGGHALLAVEHIRVQVQARGQLAQLPGRLVVEAVAFAEKFVCAQAPRPLGQLLGQIAGAEGVDDPAAHVEIRVKGGIAENGAQQRGFSVALLADERQAFAGVNGKGEVFDEAHQVLFVGEREVLYGQHGLLLVKKSPPPAAAGDGTQTLSPRTDGQTDDARFHPVAQQSKPPAFAAGSRVP